MTNATQRKTLKVFIADPHLLGGGQVRYVTNLAHQLTHLGHEVTIGCKPKSVLVDSAREAGCSVLNKLLLRGGLRPRIWWHDFKTVQEFIRKEKPDVIHVMGPRTTGYVLWRINSCGTLYASSVPGITPILSKTTIPTGYLT